MIIIIIICMKKIHFSVSSSSIHCLSSFSGLEKWTSLVGELIVLAGHKSFSRSGAEGPLPSAGKPQVLENENPHPSPQEQTKQTVCGACRHLTLHHSFFSDVYIHTLMNSNRPRRRREKHTDVQQQYGQCGFFWRKWSERWERSART